MTLEEINKAEKPYHGIVEVICPSCGTHRIVTISVSSYQFKVKCRGCNLVFNNICKFNGI